MCVCVCVCGVVCAGVDEWCEFVRLLLSCFDPYEFM